MIKYLTDKKIKLSLKDKLISQEIYKDDIKNIFSYGKKKINSKISVIVVAYNEDDDLIKNLKSWKKQTCNSFELIVVDNGLKESIKNQLKEYVSKHIILRQNVGASAGRNIGACFANSDILAFIDADGFVDECYIVSALMIFNNKNLVAVRGKVLPINPSTELPPLGYDLGNEPRPCILNIEGNLVIRKVDYLKVGGMEDVLFGYEGMVLNYRMVEFYGYDKKSIYYDPRLILYHDFKKKGCANEEKNKRHRFLYKKIVEYYPNFLMWRGLSTQDQKTIELSKIIEKLKNNLEKKDNQISFLNSEFSRVKNSKSFRLGNLLFRSIGDFYKFLTFPVNLVKILFLDKNKSEIYYNKKEKPNKVSVIMTCYNAEKYIEKSIDSVLSQTYKNLELIVVDDCSSDNSVEIIKRLQEKDKRVKLIQNKQNKGTYWSKNYAILFSDSDFVTTQDSDDTSDPTRIEKQMKALVDNHAKISFCNYVRVNDSGEWILNRGVYERLAIMGMMFKREVFKEIGYFDSVRFAADSEMYERMKKTFSDKSLTIVNEPLYLALERENSLTTSDSKIDLKRKSGRTKSGREDMSFLSLERQEYVKKYREWHNSRKKLFMPFPLTKRMFVAPDKMLKNLLKKDHLIVASIASFPARKKVLKNTVKKILPQVDKLNIYLNEYEEIPNFLLNNPKINTVLGIDKMGDLRDNGKVFFADKLGDNVYQFLIDDDLNYPDDYTQRMIAKLQRYNNEVVVGVHGVIFPDRIKRFFQEDRKGWSFREELKDDKFVNLLGTGTVAYHFSLLKLDIKDFETKGMVDIWLAVICKKENIPMVTVSRECMWLKDQNTNSPNLHEEFMNDDKIQTKIIKKYEPWNIKKFV